MKIIIVLLLLVATISCDEKAKMPSDYLIGKSAIEYVILPSANYSDSSTIIFESLFKYTRSDGMYVQTEGHYEIRNDTLEIHYACHEECDNSKCGVQQYVLRNDGKLHLTYLRARDGTIEDLSSTPFDKELDLINN